MMKKLVISLLVICTSLFVHAQHQGKMELDLEKIWSGHFDERKYVVHLMNQSPRFAWIQTDTASGPQVILSLDFNTARIVDTLFSNQIRGESDSLPTTFTYFQDFSFSPDDSKVLIRTQIEPLYTLSEISFNYVWDINKKTLKVVSANGKQLYPSFSPDSKQLAYIINANLYIMDIEKNTTIPVTVDGSAGQFLYGMADALYENGFGMTKAYEWSPDGKYIAMLRFNENTVKTYPLTIYERPYAEIKSQRYPLAGEMVPDVKVFVYDITNKLFVPVDVGVNPDQYITGIHWSPDNKTLLVQRMSRDQKKLELLRANVVTGKTSVVYTEESPHNYVRAYPENIYFIKEGRSFLWKSEKEGYTHLYEVSSETAAVTPVTSGKWEVLEVKAVDDTHNEIYYSSNESGSRQKQLYKINYDGSGRTKLTSGSGYHDTWISNDKRFFFDAFSSLNEPPVYQVVSTVGKEQKKLIENKELNDRLKNYKISNAYFFTVQANDSMTMNGWLIRPYNNIRGKMPLVLYVYGGSTHQEVLDRWGDKFTLTMRWLANQGYAVACIDPRGTPGKGEAFRKSNYKAPGDIEIEDLLKVKAHLARNYRIDSSNAAIMGWSYGGYLAALAQTKYAGRFKAAVAIAPVTNWRFYENVYAERLLSMPSENTDGYKNASPVNFAGNYKGGLFLVHGTADDNVHLHNSLELSKQLTSAMKANFEQHFYTDKTHNLSDGTPNILRMTLYTRINEFLKRELK
ncbi:MAG TPA: alpha/beta fold hydrolase [Agriterribacter sp.]|nr:alpha/beta fold hydrolase [Agriterribacter sp.]HRQ51681.1 alpha/beta fold hydrolase [Agriterribacter sp.]